MSARSTGIAPRSRLRTLLRLDRVTRSRSVTIERPWSTESEAVALVSPVELPTRTKVRGRPGTGEWGTVLTATWTDRGGHASAVLVSRALRAARQRAETGEVLQNTPRPAGRRRATLLGSALDRAERHSAWFARARRLW